MLEDVRDAGRILGRRLEGNAEHLVLVVVGKAQHLRPGLFVPVEPRQRVHLGDLLLAHELEGGVLGHLRLFGHEKVRLI